MKREDNAAEAHFQHCLDLWQKFMRGDMSPRGYSGLDSVCGRAATNFMSAEDDSEIVYEKADRKQAEAVNACVDSLPVHERDAVYKHYGISRLWRYGNLDLQSVLEAALSHLRILVSKRC